MIQSAQRMLKVEDEAATAVNRAYYACFHAALAALSQVGEEPRTHKGTHTLFARYFVASGRFDQTLAETLPYAARARERSDYDIAWETDPRAAADLVRDAERFVQAVRAMLS